jgi:hypothetical protein
MMQSSIQTGSRASIISELVDSMIMNGITDTDVSKIYKRRKYGLCVTLLSMDWFHIFLKYFTLQEIVEIDSSFTNHADRQLWLILLEKSRLTIVLKNNRLVDETVAWLILKNIHPEELLFDNYYSITPNLSDTTFSELVKNCADLKSLEVKNANYNNPIMPENCWEVLSRTCLQLKSIKLNNTIYTGLDKLIRANKNLVEFHVTTSQTSILSVGDVLAKLGHSCPLLQGCHLCNLTNQATESQIETFAQGCPQLKVLFLDLSIVATITNIVDKLFRCLGSHNPALEHLAVYNESITISTETHPIINESLQCLSNGCPLLHILCLESCKLSLNAITYLMYHSTRLERLQLSDGMLCYNGLTITKATDKLKYLKTLFLFDNSYITDERVAQLVKDCQNLENIEICDCDKLTAASLFSIAQICPNLKKIRYCGKKMTVSSLKQLLDKCPKLLRIVDDSGGELPSVIKMELHRRRFDHL